MQSNEVSIKTPEYVNLRFQSANLGSRALAFIIDNIIIFFAQLLIILLGIFAIGGFESFLNMVESSLFVVALVLLLLFVLNYGYYIFFEYFLTGQTPGKKITGIRVIQDNGHNITLLSSITRNLMRLIDTLPTGYFLGILMVFFHSENKRIGDLVAGTIVVHERPGKGREPKLDRLFKERNLPLPSVRIDESSRRSIGEQEWKLLKLYSERFLEVNEKDRSSLTKDLADLLLPKFHIEPSSKSYTQLEDTLLSLYILLREDLDFE